MALNKTAKPSILLFADWFEPGFKAGGPIRSCVNFARQMKDKYIIYVITTDRDLNTNDPYENIIIDKWTEFEEGINILYCSPRSLNWKNILSKVKSIEPAYIYMNSMYSRFFTIYPLLMHKLGLIRGKLILAPRGMLKSTAVQYKSAKKNIFFKFFQAIGMHKAVHFHATDNSELDDIKNRFGSNVQASVIPNFPGSLDKDQAAIEKKTKEISLIFIGRLHPIKNLDYLLALLPAIKGKIHLTVIGNEEDNVYAAGCKKMIMGYSSNINVQFEKDIPYKDLHYLIQQHHVLVLPTQGENFGHAIFDALSQGKPVLISDQTPWQNLSLVKAGWDIDLSKKEQFIEALQWVTDFDQLQYNEWSQGAWQYAKRFMEESDINNSYYKLFS